MTSLSATNDFAHSTSDGAAPLSQTNLKAQDTSLDAGTSTTAADSSDAHGNQSNLSQSHTLTPSRGGTLKKKSSLSKRSSLRRTSSKRNSRAGSVKDLTFADDPAPSQSNDAFHVPVPTTGNPTEVLANRFQVWRKVLKDIITYFRDLQKSYDARSKALFSLSNVMSNITAPPGFLHQGGISDALEILRDYHKKAISEGNKAKTIEEDVIVQLTGLRSDLGQKIKEIKGLSGDFKNNVDREVDHTRRAVRDLETSLEERHPDAKNDPYLVRLGVERQLERQIEEENYLHRAFLNLESSGRELESIVMGEVQKAYNAYAGIIKRESDEGYEAVENLSTGPLAIAKDHEWSAFVIGNPAFVDPRISIRRFETIIYPGKDEPAASEVKAGMLERKSKYLKSYTPGWYVLSATHLHEFKSPDRISSQQPVMSLPLSEQKLGSHSNSDSTSHKFMLKGRQSGGLHKSHAWVFRAESFDTMMAWFSDIKNLTEKTGIERDAFIRRTHARSISGGSHGRTASISEGSAMDEDEADQVPYSAAASQADIQPKETQLPQRPKPGGRFPSNLNVHTRNSQVPPVSPSENSGDHDIIAAAAVLPGSGVGDTSTGASNVKDIQPVKPDVPYIGSLPTNPTDGLGKHDSKYGDWMAPAVLGLKSSTVKEEMGAHDAPMLQSETFETVAPAAPSVPAASPIPLSEAHPPTTVAVPVGTASTSDSLATTPATEKGVDLGEPHTDLDSRLLRKVESGQVKVPGGFP